RRLHHPARRRSPRAERDPRLPVPAGPRDKRHRLPGGTAPRRRGLRPGPARSKGASGRPEKSTRDIRRTAGRWAHGEAGRKTWPCRGALRAAESRCSIDAGAAWPERDVAPPRGSGTPAAAASGKLVTAANFTEGLRRTGPRYRFHERGLLTGENG